MNNYFEEFEALERKFQERFGMPEEEKLVCYSSCYCMRQGPNPGRLYISLNHLCFYSSNFGLKNKLRFSYLELIKIKKSATGITIRTSRKEKYTFSHLPAKHYKVVLQLSNLTAKKWLQDPDWPFVSENSIFGQLKPKLSLLQGLKYLRDEDNCRSYFRLPSSEVLLSRCPGYLKQTDKFVPGSINLFQSYLCFKGETNEPKVVPLNTIVVSSQLLTST